MSACADTMVHLLWQAIITPYLLKPFKFLFCFVLFFLFFAFSTKNLLFCHNLFLNIFKYIAYINMKLAGPNFKIRDTQSQYKAIFFHILVRLIYIFGSCGNFIYTLLAFGKIENSKNLYNFLTKKCLHHLIVWCKFLLKLGLL